MSSAAARFAARYGLEDLPHTPLPDDGCPTCPTTLEAGGAPSAAPEVANIKDFPGGVPHVPHLPHTF